MTQDRLEPFFLESSGGRLFLLLRAPREADRCVLFVPPFAEEMNKSRRQMTLTAQALVNSGRAVLLVDLYGTGDSSGDFVDASWEVWKSNVTAAIEWSVETGVKIDSLVATRLGCSLAAEALSESNRTVLRTVFWQPVYNGRQFMTQFLRLRVAASMMESDTRETVDGLRRRLDADETLQIAGYELNGPLSRAIERMKLTKTLHSGLGQIHIVEVGRTSDGTLSVAGRELAQVAEENGLSVAGYRIPGDPFWTATEIVTNSAVTVRTVALLLESGPQ